jgi:alpha-L-fucosidase
LIGELAAAVRRQWLVFGLSSHRAEHWWFFHGGMGFESDVQDPRYAALYGPAQPQNLPPNEQFLEDWLRRCCELVDKYQPQLFWFDWWIEQPAFEPYLRQFAAYYYNRGAEWRRGVAINYKHQAFPEGTAVFDVERGQLAGIRPQFWQTDTSVSKNSWGYVASQDYKTTSSLVHDLIDIVSKNGALLLNIGPRADGTIPEPEVQMLLDIGRWLVVNGEAIYGTRPWKIFGEGPTQVVGGSFNDTKRASFTSQDIRFTTRTVVRSGGRRELLYATILGWPEDGKVVVKSLGTEAGLYQQEIGKVELIFPAGLPGQAGSGGQLANAQALEFTRGADGLAVTLPDQPPCDHAYVLRITPA